MKVVGIIAEFNPFHNGHKYLIEQAKAITGADYALIVMSGSFVQRGAPAWTYKWDRVKDALSCGSDVILELPISISTATAEVFAYGAVSILNALNAVDYLAFGSECGDISILKEIANILTSKNSARYDEYISLLNAELKKGFSFPAARANALSPYKDILDSPNNILGIEYIKALNLLDSKIQPITIKRIGAEYYDEKGPSASAIRKTFDIKADKNRPNIDLEEFIKEAIPSELIENYISSDKLYPIVPDDYSELLHYALLTSTKEYLLSIQDINSDLADKILKNISKFESISSFIEILKTKDLTYSRLSRALFHILLDMKDLTHDEYGKLSCASYTRVLGFNKSAQKLMHELAINSEIPLITKAADAKNILSDDSMAQFDSTLKADRIYDLVLNKKYGIQPKDGCLISPIIL